MPFCRLLGREFLSSNLKNNKLAETGRDGDGPGRGQCWSRGTKRREAGQIISMELCRSNATEGHRFSVTGPGTEFNASQEE